MAYVLRHGINADHAFKAHAASSDPNVCSLAVNLNQSLWLAGNMRGVPTNGHKGKDWEVDAKDFADDVLRASSLPDAQRHLHP